MHGTFVHVTCDAHATKTGDWCHIEASPSCRHIHVTPMHYINDVILPTFHLKHRYNVDPQFATDFNRAAAINSIKRRARAWSLNHRPMRRSTRRFLKWLRRHHHAYLLPVTRLFNQRCGIDLTRYVQHHVGTGHIALPHSHSYHLHLICDPTPRIVARATVDVCAYDATGQVDGSTRTSYHITGRYDLTSGVVIYDLTPHK